MKTKRHLEYSFQISGTFYTKKSLRSFLEETEELNKIGATDPDRDIPLFKGTVVGNTDPVRMIGFIKIYPVTLDIEFSTNNTDVIDVYFDNLNELRKNKHIPMAGDFVITDNNKPKYFKENS